MSTGDAISQKFVERNEKFDCKRYVRYWAFGVIIAVSMINKIIVKVLLDPCMYCI